MNFVHYGATFTRTHVLCLFQPIPTSLPQLSAAISQYDATLEAYVPVVMAMAHIYWDAENYGQVGSSFPIFLFYAL